MKGFFLLFAVIAIAMVVMGMWTKDIGPILGGIAYLGAAIGAWGRKRNASDET
jgi:hypothetical protein